MWKEIGIGVGIALVIFAGYLGYNIMPVILLGVMGAVLFFLLDKKGVMRNRSIGSSINQKPVDFNDIGGQAPAKQEIQEALEFMVKLDKFQKLGIRPLKGILLTGPPGTGKTLLAKAAATYTDSVFIATSGSEFIEMYAGVGAQRVRQLFDSGRQQAKKLKKKGAVIFIDEIEVLGGKRGSHTSHLEYDQTLNQLLVEMDGIKTDPEVQTLVMGATNRVDLIDAALLRPGRFDRVVNVELPDLTSRDQILKIHTSNKPLSDEIDLRKIAQDTFGFSGAQLENVCNEAAIYALREGCEVIFARHFKEAVDKVMMGEKAEKKPSADEKKRIAFHESGHAFISEYIRRGSVSYVTITSRGNALGYMRQSPASDMYLYTEEYLLNQIDICLAGACAEEIFLGNRSSGSANDFKQAVRLARQIIECGLSGLGIIDGEIIEKRAVHDQVSQILILREKHTKDILQEFSSVIEKMVQILLEKEYISGDEMQELFKSYPGLITDGELSA